jgi:hypothetical protein
VRQKTGVEVGVKPKYVIGICRTHITKDNCLVIRNKEQLKHGNILGEGMMR